MNYFKACVAFICFVLVVLLMGGNFQIGSVPLILLLLSGVSGLMIGDIFLLKSFTHLGSGRVLMIFGFQPLMLSVASYYLFNDQFSLYRLLAILFLMSCLFCFSLESFRTKGHWDIRGIIFALIGVTLDAGGLLLTKQAFEISPGLSPFLANAVRSGATVAGFFLMSLIPYFGIRLVKTYVGLEKKDKWMTVIASFFGTFVALGFYLQAIQIGHLPTISAIAGTCPLFATIIEVVKGQKKLTGYLVMATISFVIGVGILILI